MPSFLGRVIDPLVGSKSPANIFIKVVLPAPFGPVIAYRRPAIKLQVTSSNRILPPNRMVMLLTESIALDYSVKLPCVLGRVRMANYSSISESHVHYGCASHELFIGLRGCHTRRFYVRRFCFRCSQVLSAGRTGRNYVSLPTRKRKTRGTRAPKLLG